MWFRINKSPEERTRRKAFLNHDFTLFYESEQSSGFRVTACGTGLESEVSLDERRVFYAVILSRSEKSRQLRIKQLQRSFLRVAQDHRAPQGLP